MSEAEREVTMSLPKAARVLGVSWGRAWRLLLTRQLTGTQDTRGRWRVTAESVRECKKSLENGAAAGMARVGT